MNPDIGNPKFFDFTGFNEIRTLRFMFPNPGTQISAAKKPEKPRNSWVMKKNLLDLRIWEVLWFRCGGSWVLWVRRMLDSPDLGVCFGKKKWGG